MGNGKFACKEQFLLFPVCYIFLENFPPLTSNLKSCVCKLFDFGGLKFLICRRDEMYLFFSLYFESSAIVAFCFQRLFSLAAKSQLLTSNLTVLCYLGMGVKITYLDNRKMTKNCQSLQMLFNENCPKFCHLIQSSSFSQLVCLNNTKSHFNKRAMMALYRSTG